jgi:hypothetical protein
VHATKGCCLLARVQNQLHHTPRIVVSHCTCPRLSDPSPLANRFIIGTAVTNNNKHPMNHTSELPPVSLSFALFRARARSLSFPRALDPLASLTRRLQRLCDLRVHCSLAQMDSWLGQFGTGATGATTQRRNTATTKPDPCHESMNPTG